jgi:hypothetical protein
MQQPELLDKPIFAKIYEIRDIPPGFRPVVQCFKAFEARPRPSWPQSLAITVNDYLVKARGVGVRCPLIDLSNFERPLTVKIECSGTDTPFFLVVRVAEYYGRKRLLTEIFQRDPSGVATSRDQVDAAVVCPISMRPLKYPGKGKDCDHSQCFDLKTFLKYALITGQWICPVCRRELVFIDLVPRPDAVARWNEIGRVAQSPPGFSGMVSGDSPEDMGFGEQPLDLFDVGSPFEDAS